MLDAYDLQILNLQVSLNGGDCPLFSVHLLPSLANFLLCVAIVINAFETPCLGSSVEAGAQEASHGCVTVTGQLRRTHPAEITGSSLLLIEASLLPFRQRPISMSLGLHLGKMFVDCLSDHISYKHYFTYQNEVGKEAVRMKQNKTKYPNPKTMLNAIGQSFNNYLLTVISHTYSAIKFRTLPAKRMGSLFSSSFGT